MKCEAGTRGTSGRMASTAAHRPLSGPFSSFPELSREQLEAVVRDGSAEAAGRLLSEALDAVCVLALLSENGERFEVLSMHHPQQREVPSIRHLLETADRDVASWSTLSRVLSERQSLLIPELEDDESFNPAFRRLLKEVDLRSAMVVPLVARGHAVGVVGLVRNAERPRFRERDLSLAQAIADESALNLDNLRSEEHTSELQSHVNLVCRLLLEKKKKKKKL